MFFYGIGFEKKLVLVSKKICIGKSVGIGFEKNYRYWYLKKMALKKVSDSVSKKNGIGKKFRIRFLLYFGFRHTLMDNGLDDGLEVMVVKILTIS